LAFAPDNHLLAYIVGAEIIIENVFYEDEELRLPVGNDQEKMIKFSDDNNFLYHFSINPPENCFTYAIYQAATGELIEKYRHETKINNDTKYDIDFAKAHLYTIDGGRIIQTNLITGEIIQTFRGPVEDFDRFLITSMAFDPNGKWLAGAYQKSHVALWEMAGDGKPQLIIDTTTMNPNGIQNLRFMKEEVLMICSVDGAINFWDIARKSLLAKLYCVKEGYLWTTPPDEFAPNGWLYTNRTDLISLTSVEENGKVVEYLTKEDPRFKNYMQIYNDQEMVIARLNDYERYKELLENRIQMKDQTENKLLEESKNNAHQLFLKVGDLKKNF
jgi:WD40 repeat protein